MKGIHDSRLAAYGLVGSNRNGDFGRVWEGVNGPTEDNCTGLAELDPAFRPTGEKVEAAGLAAQGDAPAILL
jgi:hypothetical protein